MNNSYKNDVRPKGGMNSESRQKLRGLTEDGGHLGRRGESAAKSWHSAPPKVVSGTCLAAPVENYTYPPHRHSIRHRIVSRLRTYISSSSDTLSRPVTTLSPNEATPHLARTSQRKTVIPKPTHASL